MAVEDSNYLLLSAALISARHNVLSPVQYDLRGRRTDVPGLWGSTKAMAGPPFSPRGYAEVGKEDASFWLAICAALTRPARDGRDPFLRQGWSHACRLTGLSWQLVMKAVYDARFFGAEASGEAWALYMRAPDQRCIGSIYVAHVAGEPDVVKIGFSTQVDKRARALSREAGKTVVIEKTVPGTLLHEWAIHASAHGAIRPEWYPRTALPSWLADPAATMAEAA